MTGVEDGGEGEIFVKSVLPEDNKKLVACKKSEARTCDRKGDVPRITITGVVGPQQQLY